MNRYLSLLLSAVLAGLTAAQAVTPEEGRQIYMEAKAGKAEAQYRLGFCYLKGDGVRITGPHGKTGILPQPSMEKLPIKNSPSREPNPIFPK